MADMPAEAFRQSRRYEMQINRRKIKDEESDSHRLLADLPLADVDLSALAAKLKNKSEVNVTVLRLIKNSLIQNDKNIMVVLNTEGALRGLVREISGLDVNRQMEAAGCLCNLALADQRGCLVIMRVAGAYIVAALDSQNLELATVCAWTLGNLCGSGVAACELVARAGAVSKLCSMLRAQHDAQHDAQHAACRALELFAHAMRDALSKEHLELIVEAASQTTQVSVVRLAFIASCHAEFTDPRARLQDRLMELLPEIIRKHHPEGMLPDCLAVMYVVRALANSPRADALARRLRALMQSERGVRQDLLHLLKDPRLRTSVLWLLGNITCRPHLHYSCDGAHMDGAVHE